VVPQPSPSELITQLIEEVRDRVSRDPEGRRVIVAALDPKVVRAAIEETLAGDNQSAKVSAV
jgi:hypothetical protein